MIENNKYIELVKASFPNKIDNNKQISIGEQKGGLFNKVYKIEHADLTWYIKQYLDQNVSTIFSPPTISPQQRSKLAYVVQKECFEFNQDIKSVPEVLLDTNTNTLVIDGVSSPIVMIDLISTDCVKLEHLKAIAISIARLHGQLSTSEYLTDPVFINKAFRDFKLKIQYYDIAEQLGGAYKAIITNLVQRYEQELITVLHGDLNSRNIIINETNDKIGIIDFEQSHVGNPIYDISYFLCEIYTSCLFFKQEQQLKDYVSTFLNTYIAYNDQFDLKEHAIDLKLHLALQIIYRFLGPSRASWTFYIQPEEEKQSILNYAKEILLSSNEPLIDQLL